MWLIVLCLRLTDAGQGLRCIERPSETRTYEWAFGNNLLLQQYLAADDYSRTPENAGVTSSAVGGPGY
jgi:hypothetical protein